jgi:hypothetical protein
MMLPAKKAAAEINWTGSRQLQDQNVVSAKAVTNTKQGKLLLQEASNLPP